MFITKAEMRLELTKAGLTAGRFCGLGPRGNNRQFDLTFGLWRGTAVVHIRSARTSSAP